MTPRQIELARHALGLPNSRRESYRNHFVTGRGHADYDDWQAMRIAGWARHRNGSAISGGDDVFWLTKEGATMALQRGERLDPEDFPKAAALSGRRDDETGLLQIRIRPIG